MAVADPGILLPGLVGFALTGGPQQTLSSAGVIASGPNDLSTDGGTPTYGAAGVQLNGTIFLVKANPLGIDTDNTSFVLTAEFNLGTWVSDSEVSGKVLTTKQNDDGFEFEIGTDIAVPNGILLYAGWNGGEIYPEARTTVPLLSGAGNQFIRMSYNAVTQALAIQLNDAAPIITSDVAANITTVPKFIVGGNGYGDNFPNLLRRVRTWVGADVVQPDATYNWMANMSGGNALGRTDAEIAAYAG
jgi:hypothetical protein